MKSIDRKSNFTAVKTVFLVNTLVRRSRTKNSGAASRSGKKTIMLSESVRTHLIYYTRISAGSFMI